MRQDLNYTTSDSGIRYSLCWPGNEQLLLKELRGDLPRSVHRILMPRVIESRLVPEEQSLTVSHAFCCQTLPDPVEISGESITQLANAVVRAVTDCELLSEVEKSKELQLHVGEIDPEPGGGRRRRSVLLQETLVGLFRKMRGDLYRGLVDVRSSTYQTLLQVLLVAPNRGVVSWAQGELLTLLSPVISPWLAGLYEVAEDKQPPSRAYKKLLEALGQLQQQISAGERCVDLGAAPGSWSYCAVERGAQVTAVDRSELRVDLMDHPRLRFIRGDAFRYRPDGVVDWLLCDVIAEPERSIELLRNWISEGLCRRYVVTIKFKGRDNYGALRELKQLLGRHSERYLLRQLFHNRNEVTAAGLLSSR